MVRSLFVIGLSLLFTGTAVAADYNLYYRDDGRMVHGTSYRNTTNYGPEGQYNYRCYYKEDGVCMNYSYTTRPASYNYSTTTRPASYNYDYTRRVRLAPSSTRARIDDRYSGSIYYESDRYTDWYQDYFAPQRARYYTNTTSRSRSTFRCSGYEFSGDSRTQTRRIVLDCDE